MNNLRKSTKRIWVLTGVILFAPLFFSCQSKVLPRTFSKKPDVAFSSSYPEYRLKWHRKVVLNKEERKVNRNAEKVKRGALKEQDRLRKEHFNRQSKDVQERMKTSKKESDRLNKKKNKCFKKYIRWINIQLKKHGNR